MRDKFFLPSLKATALLLLLFIGVCSVIYIHKVNKLAAKVEDLTELSKIKMAGIVSSPISSKDDAARAQLVYSALKTEIARLQGELSGLRAEYSNFKEELNKIETDLSKLREEFKSHKHKDKKE